jgi:hypothetical protein
MELSKISVAAWTRDMFFNSYDEKIHKNSNIIPLQAKKIKTYLESFDLQVHWLKVYI